MCKYSRISLYNWTLCSLRRAGAVWVHTNGYYTARANVYYGVLLYYDYCSLVLYFFFNFFFSIIITHETHCSMWTRRRRFESTRPLRKKKLHIQWSFCRVWQHYEIFKKKRYAQTTLQYHNIIDNIIIGGHGFKRREKQNKRTIISKN